MPFLKGIPNQRNKPEVTSSTCLGRKFQGEQPVCEVEKENIKNKSLIKAPRIPLKDETPSQNSS